MSKRKLIEKWLRKNNNYKKKTKNKKKKKKKKKGGRIHMEREAEKNLTKNEKYEQNKN